MSFQNIENMNWSAVLNDTYTLVFLTLFVIGLVALFLYYGLIYLRVARKRVSEDKMDDGNVEGNPMVSVVIVAHNEAEQLKKCLPYLLEQEYDNYEVVVVDYTSSSDDDTQFVLKVCEKNYNNLKPITFSNDVNMFKGIKYPLSIGIKSAKGDIILLTEPSCVPVDFNWVGEMAKRYSRDTQIVLGYNLVGKQKGLLNFLEQYDSIATNASCLAMASWGHPYSATGCNLSYRRDFFFQQGGFIKHYTIPEGADDLFVNQNANEKNTQTAVSASAAVMSEPSSSFQQWHLRRKRRYMTRRHYKAYDRALLSVYPISLFLFYFSFVALLVGGLVPWYVVVAVLGAKIIWQTISFAYLANRFNIKKIRFFAFPLEFYFLFANTFLHILSLRRKN